MRKIIWEDTPKKLNLFTIRNATMRDLDTGEIIQYYSANTKISVVQKTQLDYTTYYRTASAKERGLNWAFEASAFGLPNEIAPPVPSLPNSLNDKRTEVLPPLPKENKKKTAKTKATSPKGGEEGSPKPKTKLRLLSRLFGKRRK